jgi:uncharacterized protein (DUF58 family)
VSEAGNLRTRIETMSARVEAVNQLPPSSTAFHQGPGDLTLASIVLFTLGAYGVAAGAATGEEAVVAVGVFAFTLFVVGIVWPIASLARARVEVDAPPDATVGETIELRVRVEGRVSRVELRVLDPPGAWLRTASPARGTVAHVAARRGVFRIVRVQLRSSAPLGVFVRMRTIRVELPFEIAVAPRADHAVAMLQAVPDELFATSPALFAVGGGDTVRAVRPYVPGDPARLVHWPTSARRGELVVREYEPPPALGVALVIDLRGADPEAAASRAMGIGVATLRAGGFVWCGTCENDGPVGGMVADVRTLGRRLARAVEGEPAGAPARWPVERVQA